MRCRRQSKVEAANLSSRSNRVGTRDPIASRRRSPHSSPPRSRARHRTCQSYSASSRRRCGVPARCPRRRPHAPRASGAGCPSSRPGRRAAHGTCRRALALTRVLGTRLVSAATARATRTPRRSARAGARAGGGRRWAAGVGRSPQSLTQISVRRFVRQLLNGSDGTSAGNSSPVRGSTSVTGSL